MPKLQNELLLKSKILISGNTHSGTQPATKFHGSRHRMIKISSRLISNHCQLEQVYPKAGTSFKKKALQIRKIEYSFSDNSDFTFIDKCSEVEMNCAFFLKFLLSNYLCQIELRSKRK